MIKINRELPPQGTALDQKKQKALENIECFIRKGLSPWQDKNFFLWSDKKVKSFLYNAQNGKCAYCERKRDQKELSVEHFRPKGKVKESLEHKGYWWLAYEWGNLLIACKSCNQNKCSYFPLEDEAKRALKCEDDIGQEKPALINPLEEDPEQFVGYEIPKTHNAIMLKAVGKNSRGNTTITRVGLNDKNVMQDRADKLREFALFMNIAKGNNFCEETKQKIKQHIERSIADQAPFAGMARFYFKEQSHL